MSEDAFQMLQRPVEAGNRPEFDRRMNQLDDAFVSAALSVVEAMPGLTASFLDGDVSAVEDARLMAAVVADGIRRVEDEGFVLLARESPVGRDLRRLVAILRLATDVERSASLLKHVSEAAQHMDARVLPESLRGNIRELAARSADVLRAGIDAWRSRDGSAMDAVDEMDETVDQLQLQLLEAASAGQRDGAEMMVIGLIARYFERIADHGVALAKDATFVVTGERTITKHL